MFQKLLSFETVQCIIDMNALVLDSRKYSEFVEFIDKRKKESTTRDVLDTTAKAFSNLSFFKFVKLALLIRAKGRNSK